MSHNRALPSAPLLRIPTRLALYAACLGSLVLFLTACDDDLSGVGVGVGDDPLKGGEPVTVNLPPTTLDVEDRPPVTGAVGPSRPERFFAGQVDDPLAGRTETNGFLNIFQPANVPSSVLEDDLTDVSLQLAPVSVYGDTTEAVTLTLYDMPAPWEAEGARSDTTLTSGDPITTFELDPTDEETFVSLPSDWVEANQDVLRDTTDGGQSFIDTFPGFRIGPAENGNAAVGFSRNDTSLRVATQTDTTNFSGRLSLTTIDRDPPEQLPDDRILVQGGVERALTFTYDFETAPLDTLQGTPVNRAEFVLPVDSTLWETDTPEGFVRPIPSSYQLTGISTDGEQTVTLADDISVSDGALRITGNAPFQIFEEGLQRTSAFSKFVITPSTTSDGAVNELSLDVALFHQLPLDPDATDEGPRATVTVTPF